MGYRQKSPLTEAAAKLRDMGSAAIARTAPKKPAMISKTELAELIKASIPDADVEANDWTGTQDHYNVRVVSARFAGVPLMDQHRLVYGAVDAALKDGRLHALQIKTETPREQRMSQA
jgi:stress-induced morphogen